MMFVIGDIPIMKVREALLIILQRFFSRFARESCESCESCRDRIPFIKLPASTYLRKVGFPA